MMKKFYWMNLLFHIVGFQLYAQQIIRGKVQDSSSQPIPFVSIGFVGTSIGTVADLNGIFQLTLNQAVEKNAQLRFSCVGYDSQEFVIVETDSIIEKTVELNPSIVKLEEVVIGAKIVEKKSNGNRSENTAMKTNLAISKQPNMNLGAEVGRKFRLSHRNHWITGMKFYMAYNNFDTLILRINFYDLKMNSLQRKSIIRTVTGIKRGWVSFDLSAESIVMSGNIVASVEWVGASKKGNAFGLNITMPAPAQTHYYKYGAQNSWKVFPGMSTSMVLESEIWE